MSADSYTWLCI